MFLRRRRQAVRQTIAAAPLHTMFLPEPYRGSCNALRAVNTGLSHFLCRTTGSQTVPMKMQDWIQKFDASLTFYEYEILQDAGKVRHDVAIRLAEKVYESIRSSPNDIKQISINTGIPEVRIERIKDHIFNKKQRKNRIIFQK